MSQLKDLGEAWLKAKKEIVEISFVKDAKNGGKGNSYISLDAINKELEPILTKNSLTFQIMKNENDIFTGTLLHLPSMQSYTCSYGKIELVHKSKRSDGSEYEIMNTAQAQGATLTYARRYVTSCFFNIVVDADTDGEVGKSTHENVSSYSKTPPKAYNHRSSEPKIQDKNITIEDIRVVQRDYTNPQGVLKCIVGVKTKEGESEKIHLNFCDKKGVKKQDMQLFGAALSYLLQTKDNSFFKVPIEVTQKIGLSPEAIRHLEERKRTNILEIESLQKILQSQEYANTPI